MGSACRPLLNDLRRAFVERIPRRNPLAARVALSTLEIRLGGPEHGFLRDERGTGKRMRFKRQVARGDRSPNPGINQAEVVAFSGDATAELDQKPASRSTLPRNLCQGEPVRSSQR